MEKRFGILIVDSDEEFRKLFRGMLAGEKNYYIVGETADPRAAVEMADHRKPDAVFVEVVGLSEGMDVAAEILRRVPTTTVIITCTADACHDVRDTVREAMRIGVKDFLMKPFTVDEFRNAMRNTLGKKRVISVPDAPSSGHVVAVFATKGGVGKTTLAVNLAVALGEHTGRRVALADMDLEFGNAAALFGGQHPKASIVDLCQRPGRIDEGVISQVIERPAGYNVDLLAAPSSPEQAALVDGEGRQEQRNYVGEVLGVLRGMYPWVVVDTACNFRETNMTILDQADTVLLLTTPDTLALRNTAACLDLLLGQLEYGEEKVKLVLNRYNSAVGITIGNINRGLNYQISFSLPSDAVTAVNAANTGIPFMKKRARNQLTERIVEIVEHLAGPQGKGNAKPAVGKARAFGLSLRR